MPSLGACPLPTRSPDRRIRGRGDLSSSSWAARFMHGQCARGVGRRGERCRGVERARGAASSRGRRARALVHVAGAVRRPGVYRMRDGDADPGRRAPRRRHAPRRRPQRGQPRRQGRRRPAGGRARDARGGRLGRPRPRRRPATRARRRGHPSASTRRPPSSSTRSTASGPRPRRRSSTSARQHGGFSLDRRARRGARHRPEEARCAADQGAAVSGLAAR